MTYLYRYLNLFQISSRFEMSAKLAAGVESVEFTYFNACLYSAGQSSIDPNKLRMCIKSKYSSGYVHKSRASSISNLQLGGLHSFCQCTFLFSAPMSRRKLTPSLAEWEKGLFQPPLPRDTDQQNLSPKSQSRFPSRGHS